MSSPLLLVEEVRTSRQQADFWKVKRDLCRADPAAVLPLRRMEWLQLDPTRHPFYHHARREVWIARRDGRPVGRIAAIVDELHQAHYADRTGFFGFFEAPRDPAVAGLLLETARAWLRSEGCDRMRGPVNPSMKGEFGVLDDGHAWPPFLMMAHTPAYYGDLLTGAGLSAVRTFHSFLWERARDTKDTLEKFAQLEAACRRIAERHPEIEIRQATRLTLEPMLHEVNRIGNLIRSRNWGFVPLTGAELDFMVGQLRRIIDPRTVVGAFIDDRMVGYNVTIPNLNWALRRCRGENDWVRLPQLLYWMRRIPEVRLIAVGVDPAIRARGISALLTKAMTDQGPRYSAWEFGWIDGENLASISALDRAIPLRRYKTWRLFEQPL